MKTQPPCCVQGFLVTLWDHPPTFRICSVGTTPFFPHFICAYKVFWPVGIDSRSLTSCILKQTNEPKKNTQCQNCYFKKCLEVGCQVHVWHHVLYRCPCHVKHGSWIQPGQHTKLCQKVSAQAAQPPSLGFNQCKFWMTTVRKYLPRKRVGTLLM